VRAQKGWAKERSNEFAFKPGDSLYAAFECRSIDTLLVFGSNGRVYSIAVSALPGARGDGQPVTTLMELEAGTTIAHYFAGAPSANLLLSTSGGYGFIASVENMTSRQKGGKAFINCNEGDTVCMPSPINVASPIYPGVPVGVVGSANTGAVVVAPAATHVACASTGGRILTFEIGELKPMANGGRGLMLIDLEDKDTLAGAAAYTRSVRLEGVGRGGKARDETLEIRSLNNARAARGRKGKAADLGFKPNRILRVE
jgi:topoisomerase-4 subunit A